MAEDNQKQDLSVTTSSILEIRRIEAGILKQVYDSLCERYGKTEAREVLAQTISKAAIAQGKQLAELVEGKPDLDDFMEIMQMWTRNGALEIDVLESNANQVNFNVTRCKYADMYKEMGLKDIGDILSCNRDGLFCVGYNDDIEFERTQTIMGGASHCDFRYSLDTAKSDSGGKD
ncbi:MAG: L-2-amino-thiazoline-4-carboxylic acid hydrolase [Rhizobiales bacterium]|nr:L-2-amino-thiazoline-4-carboxylic acid hydrolase [Hyphomicrobiales bacterium]